MGFSLASSQASAAAPFCVGFAFRKGDIPAGQAVTGSIPHLQVTAKNRWPDGSLKFAVVAGRMALAANSTSAVTLSPGAASGGADLTLADLKATGVAASIGGGAYGNANWAAGDWDSPFQAWVLGPEMSSWIYRKPVGSDAHLVAWLEVRLYAGGAVEVLPWIENGYIRVAAGSSKSAAFSFTLGGTQRFSQTVNLPSHCRTPLLSGSALSYWLGTDPAVVVRHDTAYLQNTRLVPTYRATVPSSATSVVASLPASFVPLQLGNFVAAMGNPGYQPTIGLLPEWDVLYLTCPTSDAPWSALQRNGYSAGRWGTHYRDENTNRPLRFSSFPALSVNNSTTGDYPAATTGTAAPPWAVSHHPSLGYMAYLVTGRWYFMEEVQFAATFNYLVNVDGGPYANRGGSAGIFKSNAGANTVRGAAWAVRTLAQAATVTADADTALRGEFVASLEANINFNHATYVAQPNNPFGIVAPYGDAYGGATDSKVTEASWQQDFYTAAYGYALAMDPPVSASAKTKLSEFFAWKAKSIVGRLGGAGSTEWLYRDAAPYTFVVALVDTPDYAGGTGPWPANWGALYSATFVASPGARTAGDLRGGNFPEATSYWGNLQPALAYAVEHGVPGAADAYRRVTTAGNWPSLATSFNVSPVWGVRPPIEP